MPMRFARACMLAGLLAAAGCARPFAGPGASPQRVFERARASAVAGDWQGYYECLAPARRDEAIGALLYLASFARMNGSASEAEYVRLMRAHGLDPQPPQPDTNAASGDQLAHWLAPAADRGRLFAELMAYTRSVRKTEPPLRDRAARLSALHVTGEAAVATLHTGDGRTRTLRFVRVGGAWYLAD